MKFLEEEQTLFKDEGVLSYDFLPDKLPGRELEEEEVSLAIKPLVSKRKPLNMFVHGQRGIGKTACVKHVFKKVEEETPIKTVFINCWESTSSFAILQRIAIELSIPTPRRGTSKDEALNSIKQRLHQVKGVVLALDEVDKIEDKDILYQVPEFFENKISMILITNHREFVLELDDRTKSRLSPNHLEFLPYSVEDVDRILSERVEYALIPNSINKSALNKIVNICYEKGDIRVGLFLLLNAGRNAEYDNRLKIQDKDVEKAFKKLETNFSLAKKVELSDEEKFLFGCVKKNNHKTSKEIYGFYAKNGGKLSERSYRKYINHLLQLNLIEVKEIKTGSKGRTREISVKCLNE